MTDLALRVENLSKLYKIGKAQRRHDTLRDQLSAFSDQLADWSKRIFTRPSPLSPDPSDDTIWALHDVSFEVKRGEVVGTLAPHCVWCSAGVIGRNGAGTLAPARSAGESMLTSTALSAWLKTEGLPHHRANGRARDYTCTRWHNRNAVLRAAPKMCHRACVAVQVLTGVWVRSWKAGSRLTRDLVADILLTVI